MAEEDLLGPEDWAWSAEAFADLGDPEVMRKAWDLDRLEALARDSQAWESQTWESRD